MIPQTYIIEWKKFVPWVSDAFVEQDLILSCALSLIFSDSFLSERLVLRGGTAIHKLLLHPQVRYSEDIDLVQIKAEPAGQMINQIRKVLSFLGKPKIIQKSFNNTLIFKFDSEIQPIVPLKLKVEINTREHFNLLSLDEIEFQVNSSWFSRSIKIKTYNINELLGSKLRALYQRSKGRDLFDIWYVMTKTQVNAEVIVASFHNFIEFQGVTINKDDYLKNLEAKISDPLFLGDIKALLRPGIGFSPDLAFELIRDELIEKI